MSKDSLRGWVGIVSTKLIIDDSVIAAGDEEGFAGDPAGIAGSEERGHRGDVLRLADAAERSICFDLFLEIAAMDASAVQTFGLDHAGVDGIDADLARAEFAGE